jgi:hypothetical protein
MSPHLHSSTTTPAKARHYTEAVTEALLKGDWGGSGVVRGVKGDVLDWTEGARKWEKHTGGGEFRNVTVKGLKEAHKICTVCAGMSFSFARRRSMQCICASVFCRRAGEAFG